MLGVSPVNSADIDIDMVVAWKADTALRNTCPVFARRSMFGVFASGLRAACSDFLLSPGDTASAVTVYAET